jgi:hypothetical protein
LPAQLGPLQKGYAGPDAERHAVNQRDEKRLPGLESVRLALSVLPRTKAGS